MWLLLCCDRLCAVHCAGTWKSNGVIVKIERHGGHVRCKCEGITRRRPTKRFVRMLIVSLFSAGCLCGCTRNEEPTDTAGRYMNVELLDNTGFEEGTAPWSVSRWVSKQRWDAQDAGVEFAAAVRDDCGTQSVRSHRGITRLEQTVQLDTGNIAGSRYAARVSGISGQDNGIVLQLVSDVAGEDKPKWLGNAMHPGDGAWHDVRLSGILPAGIEPESITVQLILRSAGPGDGLVDNVSLRLLQETPADSHATSCRIVLIVALVVLGSVAATWICFRKQVGDDDKTDTVLNRKDLLFALIFLLLAACVWIGGYNRRYFTNPDAFDYAQIGREIVRGNGFSTQMLAARHIVPLSQKGHLENDKWPDLGRFPGPALSNACAQLLISNPVDAAIAQSGLWYVLSVLVLFLLARRMTNLTVAVLSTLFFASDPLVFYSSYDGMTESLASFAVLCFLLAAFPMRDRTYKWLAVGALASVGYLVRANLAFLAPVAMLLAIFGAKRGNRLRAAVLVAVAGTIVFMPWGIRNVIVAGNPFFSFNTPQGLAWNAVPGHLYGSIHDPVDTSAMLAEHGPAIREKITGNLLPKLVSPTFWHDMFAPRDRYYHPPHTLYVPFVLFFFISMFRRKGKNGMQYRSFKWACAAFLLANFAVCAVANHLERYYMPLRALIILVGMNEILDLARGSEPGPRRRALGTAVTAILLIIGACQYYTSTALHNRDPDLNQTWPMVSNLDVDAYATVKQAVPESALIATDLAYEVALFADRRALWIMEDPAELLDIDENHIAIDAVLIGRRVFTWRAKIMDQHTDYPAFLKTPEFLDRYELKNELDNGAELFVKR